MSWLERERKDGRLGLGGNRWKKVKSMTAAKGIAVIVVYQMLEERHPIFGMPRLTKATADGNCLVIVSTEVRAIFPRIHRTRP